MENTQTYGFAPGQGPAPSTEGKLDTTNIKVETSDNTYGSVENFDDLELKDNLIE